MAEDNTTPDPAVVDPPEGDTTDWKAEAEKWKAMSRKHETGEKEGRDAIRKLKELEDADKSEADKARETATAAEQRANAAEARALRLEIAAAKGLTPAQAKRLVGSTAEELESDADELLASFKPADTDGADRQGGVKEKLRGGAVSETTDDEADLKDVLAAIPRA